MSGPLLDRFDLQVELQALTSENLGSEAVGEPSAVVAERVIEARRRQSARLARAICGLQAQLPSDRARRHRRVNRAGMRLLRLAVDRLGLSARAHDAVLRVAGTIADLEAEEEAGESQVAEAIQYRHFDKRPTTGDFHR